MASGLSVAVGAVSRWMDSDHMDGGGWVMMGIVLLVIIVLVLGLVYFMVRDSSQRGGGSGPLDVLNHRFARGEIDEEEYQKRRDVLTR
jgi:putative membrane protein